MCARGKGKENIPSATKLRHSNPCMQHPGLIKTSTKPHRKMAKAQIRPTKRLKDAMHPILTIPKILRFVKQGEHVVRERKGSAQIPTPH
jgi:hypothetical protein